MQSESIKLRDFRGQNIYVGMDVHHKSWKIHIYSDEFELNSPQFLKEDSAVSA